MNLKVSTEVPARTWQQELQDAIRTVVALADPWTWRMAARDTRGARRRLIAHALAIVAGVAALVAVGSFATGVQNAINEQAKGLLGSDLTLGARTPFGSDEEALFKEIGGETSREISFSSMIFFPKNEGSRLVQIRAIQGAFPFYGELETFPSAASQTFRSVQGLVIEESILAQFGAGIGDRARVGQWEAPILGALRKVPGETMAFSTMAPRVFMAMDRMPETGLLKTGSLVRYRIHFKLPKNTDVEALVKKLKPRLDKLKLAHQTVEQRKEDLGRSMANLQRFLRLSGFVALLLGAVGLASALHVHIKERLGVIAVLRCLGAPIHQTVSVYLAQAIFLGFTGGLLGTVVGLTLQQALPQIGAEFIPIKVTGTIHWAVASKAMLGSVGAALLFGLLPLLPIRRVSPLAVIRMPFSSGTENRRDPLSVLVKGIIVAAVTWYSIRHSENWRQGLGLAGGLAFAFFALAGVGSGLSRAARRWTPSGAAFIWRQGIANLHRPNNRTVLTLAALGFATFLVLALSMVQTNLLRELVTDPGGTRPNMIVFDVQPDQRAGVESALSKAGAPLLDAAPVVNMRIGSVNGTSVEALLADKTRHIPNWVLRREYRSTYRSKLMDSETLVAGSWIGTYDTNSTDSLIPISLEEGIAKDLKVGLGDKIAFDIQGTEVRTRIASLRKVDWRRVQANFFVVFPQGAIEEAPTWYILATRANGAEASAKTQRAITMEFPTVSILDLELVLRTMDEIVGKIAFGVRFMAAFTLATGLLVLAGAIWSGRTQRVSESVLLRTLGASRRQVLGILFVEYSCLGFIGAITGGILAVVGSWALAQFSFKIPFSFDLLPVLLSIVGVCLVTLATGLIASVGLTRHPPLAVLRDEQR